MAFTISFANRVLDYIYGGVAIPAANLPASIYVGLHVGASAPNIGAGTGVVEPSGGNYARYTITRNQTNFPAAASGSISNNQIFNFNKASADWGTVTHIVVYDALTVGNIIEIFALTGGSKIITNGDTAQFAVGDLQFTQS